jgi:hypothetical protein
VAKAPTKRTQKASSKAALLGEEKLKSSGLTLEDGKKLGMSFIDGAATLKLHKRFKDLCSLKIEYFDLDGKSLPDWPKAPPFYRLRYLEKDTSFEAMTEKKEPRYVQEPNTAPVAYYPKNQPNWPLLAKDVYHPLIITEGELKAAKACKEGFPTIGLGGVYNWRSNKLGITWLPTLELVNWVRRNVYIVFDSDYKTNPMVCSALRELADALHDRGAFVHLVSLPQVSDDADAKIGLDDFFVQTGPGARDQFEKLLSEAEPLGLTKPLFSFNEKYVYVQSPGLIVNQKSKTKIAPNMFTGHLESTQSYQERQVRPDGGISYKAVSAATAWIKWPLRREVYKITYQPGKEPFITDKGVPYFNVWTGWGVAPKKGDVKPFLQLLDHIFTRAEKGAKEWFVQWLAFPLQYPGTKMHSSAVIHGIKHGTGKSLIGYSMGRIYGENFTEISQTDLHNGFNEWAEGKQFAMGDDVTGSNKRAENDFLKKLITQRTLRLNPKYIPSYEVPDVLNYYFTANGPDSFFLEDDDRRYFIHEVIVGPLPHDFYVEYELWLDSGGSAAIFDYLLNLDLGDFNPKGPAFKTAARDRMISNVQSDLGAWCRNLINTPDHVLRIGEIVIAKDLFTSKELLQFYDYAGKTGTTANGLGRELARAGVRQVNDGKPVKLSDGSQARYYAIRNSDTWINANPQQIVKHLDSWLKKNTIKESKY